jgi:hypothetical protein
MARDRVLVSKGKSLVSRVAVYRTKEAIEEQEIEGYDVSLRRVFLDEVMLVTQHRTTNWMGAIGSFIFFGIVAFWCLMAGLISESLAVGAIAFAVCALPLLVLLLLYVLVKVEVVTVFGRRMRIQMRFWLRKARGRQVFEEVCRAARQTQERSSRARPTATPLLPLEPGA